MSEPVPGKNYKSIKGDTFRSIATRAYGLANREGLIREANAGKLEPLGVGASISIPFLTDLIKRQGQPKGSVSKSAITLIVGSKELDVLSIEIFKIIDKPVFGWSAKIEWIPSQDAALDEILTPYSYPLFSLFIGQELVMGGLVYNIAPSQEGEQSVMNLQGFSFAADAMDSSVEPPYETNKITLEERADKLIRRFGIEVEFDVDSGGVFDRITADKNEKIGDHLLKLATQRGFLITSTPAGNIFFTKADQGINMGLVEQNDPIVLGWSANYDGRERFFSYRVFGQSPLNNNFEGRSLDNNVPRARALNFFVDDATTGNIQNTANWKKTRQVAKAFNLSLRVMGWFAPNGKLWKEGNKITIYSPVIFIKKEFEFLIKGVTFSLVEDAQEAVLNLVPPQVFSGGEIEDPWL